VAKYDDRRGLVLARRVEEVEGQTVALD